MNSLSSAPPWGASKSLTSTTEIFLEKEYPLNLPGKRQPHPEPCLRVSGAPFSAAGRWGRWRRWALCWGFVLPASHQLEEKPPMKVLLLSKRAWNTLPSSVLPCSWEKQRLKRFIEKSLFFSPTLNEDCSSWAPRINLGRTSGLSRALGGCLASGWRRPLFQSVVAEANQLPRVVQGLNTSEHTDPDVH